MLDRDLGRSHDLVIAQAYSSSLREPMAWLRSQSTWEGCFALWVEAGTESGLTFTAQVCYLSKS